MSIASVCHSIKRFHKLKIVLFFKLWSSFVHFGGLGNSLDGLFYRCFAETAHGIQIRCNLPFSRKPQLTQKCHNGRATLPPPPYKSVNPSRYCPRWFCPDRILRFLISWQKIFKVECLLHILNLMRHNWNTLITLVSDLHLPIFPSNLN